MQFTPQQLAGGAKFSSVTRIGNWQEEIALEESKIENFKKRSAAGSLSLRKLENKTTACNELVPFTFSPDGYIRFGDNVIVQHDSSGTILACDPFEQVQITNETTLVTTFAHNGIQPRARYTFKVVRPPRHLQDLTDREDDSILRVGQPFLLQCNDSLLIPNGSNSSTLLAPPSYLCSTKKNERTATKRSNRQMVFMNTTVDGDAIWYASVPSRGKANGTERFLAVGSPVSNSVSYQLTHRQTNMYLTCDSSYKFSTEFGIEHECYADRSTAFGKIGLMVSEFKGLTTSQTLAKPDAQSFSWHFVTSNDESTSKDSRVLPPSSNAENILKTIQDFIRNKGIDAFWNLRQYLLVLMKKKLNLPNGTKIDRLDLKNALLEWGLQGISNRYLDVLLDMVDADKLGLINVQEFLRLVSGQLSSRREKVLIDVFDNVIDSNRQHYVTVGELRGKFRGEDHPLVSMGGYAEDFAFEHLLQNSSLASSNNNNAKFTLNHFIDYYSDLSAAVDDDEYFEAIVRSNWR